MGAEMESERLPKREPLLEYGRAGPAERGVACGVPPLGGAGLAVNLGGAIPRWLIEKLRAGVGAKVGCFRSGDSGRGRDGRDFLN